MDTSYFSCMMRRTTGLTILCLLIVSISLQSCFLRRKNRCNSCPKWESALTEKIK